MQYFKSICGTFNYGTENPLPNQCPAPVVAHNFKIWYNKGDQRITSVTETSQHAYWLAAMLACMYANVSYETDDACIITMPRYDQILTLEPTDQELMVLLAFKNNLGYIPMWFVPIGGIKTYQSWIIWQHRFEDLIRANIDQLAATRVIDKRQLYKDIQACASARHVHGL